MPFFGRNYTLRRYGEDTVVNGYPVAEYEDISVVLDVQTLSDDEVIETGGSRDRMMLKTFGDFPIRCSKQEDGVRSDQLLYEGRWFECMSSRLSENTLIKHWTSTFELIPVSQNPAPTETEES
ncbi:MAG: hypothetical protein LUH14_10365 [Clostridiaceae bacterium]|nr:hypothetical protein [Clostridiaceae bacterium]